MASLGQIRYGEYLHQHAGLTLLHAHQKTVCLSGHEVTSLVVHQHSKALLHRAPFEEVKHSLVLVQEAAVPQMLDFILVC